MHVRTHVRETDNKIYNPVKRRIRETVTLLEKERERGEKKLIDRCLFNDVEKTTVFVVGYEHNERTSEKRKRGRERKNNIWNQNEVQLKTIIALFIHRSMSH